jgi:ferredoxin-NADP reductase
MNQHTVKILSTAFVTPDVLSIKTEKPHSYHFEPGQATEMAINKNGWKKMKRPFTFTSLPSDEHLEFTIKTYPSHKGLTNEMLNVRAGDELILHEVFGTISYQGPGLFVAGGAGVTPFIAIFRQLRKSGQLNGNRLLCANKTKKDIILENEFSFILGTDFINILSQEKVQGYENGYITGAFLVSLMTDDTRRVYLCGPPPMMHTVEKFLMNSGEAGLTIIKEEF